ncbi:TPA: hypothetical protein ACHP3V_004871 [Pseudomonas aeruginosa]
MAITLILGCKQGDFNARHDGSCEGISFYFCMRALDLGPVPGLADLMQQRNIGGKVERIMDLQDQICGGLMSSGTYETGIDGVPISNPSGATFPVFAIRARRSRRFITSTHRRHRPWDANRLEPCLPSSREASSSC